MEQPPRQRWLGREDPDGQRYNHPLVQAHQAAAEQVADLVRKAGGAS